MSAFALAVLLTCALALRLWTAWSDLDNLLLHATSDDAYYYLQIARNLATGHGASFDGETPTNGFHPLWLLIVAGVQAVVHDPFRAIHVTLTLAACFGTATVGLVYAIVRRLSGREGPALTAAAFYGLHPYVVVESVNGLETALAVFGVALTSWLFLGIATRHGPPRLADGLRLGLAAGLMMLARTDSVFVWVPILLYLGARARDARALVVPLAAGAVSAAVVAPWLVWGLVRFGTLVQVSALAVPEPLRQQYLAEHGDSLLAVLQRSWDVTRQALLHRLVHTYFVPPRLPAWPAWLAVTGALAGTLLAPPEPERSNARRRLALLLVPGAGILLGLLYHSAVRWWLREWYFAPAGWLAAPLLGLTLAHARELLDRVPAARRAAAVVALYTAVAVPLAALLGPHQHGSWLAPSPHRVQQLEAARWLEKHTAPDARVGSFNAGILGYFSSRRVVNLDGAVNADAYRARLRGRLMDYVLAKQLEYVVDWRGTLPQLRCRENPAARCERVAVVGDPLPGFAGSPISVIRVSVVSPPRGRR
jgi:4-amino-4-deoxy-L-arabinose transferase-like glycosyltransferase